jgi:flagellar basal body-associated protein FliL
MISCAQAEKKIKKMKKSIMILMMVATGFFASGKAVQIPFMKERWIR